MPTMQLSILLEDIFQLPVELEREITHLTLDSRVVESGYLFFACPGTHQDGREFIANAIEKGASVVLAESDTLEITFFKNIPVIPILNLRDKLSLMAAKFFGFPARSMRMIGITGTNGKTSCSHFIAAALHQLNIACGVIGTLGSGVYGNIQPGNLTTPDAVTLQATLAAFVKQDIKVVAMEVSSHSIDQKRVKGIPFEIAIFTNLTRDHLDYHGDMETYGAVKKRLFVDALPKYSVINADDLFGKELLLSLRPSKNVFAYTLAQDQIDNAKLSVTKVIRNSSGMHAQVASPWGKGLLDIALIGEFNLSNILAVLAALCLLDIPFADACRSLSHLKPVFGRMQTVGGGKDQPLIVVDYSHTPDALEKALIALRQHCQGQLYCIFGCGGERDKGKRPIMAKIAEQYADKIVVTDDNPRHEDPAEIVADILPGFAELDKVIVQHDRSKAIQDIIQCAVVGDCVLIAGKGGETYQIIGDTKRPFDDVEVVTKFLAHLSPV